MSFPYGWHDGDVVMHYSTGHVGKIYSANFSAALVRWVTGASSVMQYQHLRHPPTVRVFDDTPIVYEQPKHPEGVLTLGRLKAKLAEYGSEFDDWPIYIEGRHDRDDYAFDFVRYEADFEVTRK